MCISIYLSPSTIYYFISDLHGHRHGHRHDRPRDCHENRHENRHDGLHDGHHDDRRDDGVDRRRYDELDSSQHLQASGVREEKVVAEGRVGGVVAQHDDVEDRGGIDRDGGAGIPAGYQQNCSVGGAAVSHHMLEFVAQPLLVGPVAECSILVERTQQVGLMVAGVLDSAFLI